MKIFFKHLLCLVVLVSSCSFASAEVQPKHMKQKPIQVSFKDGFAQVVDKVIKSVVNISIKQNNSENQLIRDSLGSGVIVDSGGYIITNSHVIEGDGEQDISVVLYDGTELKARVIGRDSRADIALLKVDTRKKLLPIKWGDSDKAKVGNWVIAIGNPEGFGNTVTSGIISCRARDLSSKIQEIGGGNDLVDYIQIDASINSGNSGGPIFNTNGEVIGIVSISVTSTGSNVGLNFAMPSNCVKGAVDQLRKYGKMRRGWIGVQMDELEPDVAKSLGLADTVGSVVSRVIPDSPAFKAGFMQGDIVVEVNHKKVSNHTLNRMIADTPAGSVVPVKIIRNGVEIALTVTVEYRDDDSIDEANGYVITKNSSGFLIKECGLYVENLTKNTASILEIPKNIKGVVIVRMSSDFKTVQRNEPSQDTKEIRVGDLITRVNKTPIKDVNDFISCMDAIKKNANEQDKTLALLIYRGGLSFYKAVAINFQKKK